MKRLAISLLASLLLLSATAAFGQVCDLTGRRIFIDPGHGGTDPGAIGPTGLQEKDVTLDVGLRLRVRLEALGATVGMSRGSDIFISLADRADKANVFGAHRFISVHINSFTDPSANGTEVFVVPNPREVTRDFGQGTLKYLLTYLGLRNRGLKFANFAVLVRTIMPAALSESAFISNPSEEALLRNPDVRERIAEAHAYAICQNIYAYDEATDESGSSQVDPETLRAQFLNSYQGQLKLIGIIKGETRLVGPKFSLDGNLIAFSAAGYQGLYMADLMNLQPQQLTAGRAEEFNFGWSPESRAVAFTPRKETVVTYIKDEQVWIEVNGESQQVTNDELSYSDPKLSPTKDKVLVTGSNKEGSFLFVIDLKTKERNNLSLLGVGRSSERNIGYEGTWSPDGRRVLFSLTLDDGHMHVASDLYVIDYNGENLVRLTDDGSVKLNPDWSVKNQIAFESSEGGIIIAEMPKN